MGKSLSEYCRECGKSTLLDEWDREKNAPETPDSVCFGSKRRVWWRCAAGHEWEASIGSRVQGCGCPYCAGKRVWPGDNDLATLFPHLAAQWHPEKNGSLTPETISPYSSTRVWWRCEAGHEWLSSARSRAQGGGCPYCTNRVILPGFNDLAATHPALAQEWDSARNGSLSPDGVFAGSLRRVWWQCAENPAHRWRASIADRAGKGSGCPICQGRTVLPGENDLRTRFPHLAAEWDGGRNCLTPLQVTAYSRRMVFWRCPRGHSYAASVLSRTAHGSGCPYCAGRKVLAGFNDLATLEPRIAAQWHPTLNGALTPEQVTVGSSKKVYWECSEHHVWQTTVCLRTGPRKTGCPICAGNCSARRKARYDELLARARLSSPTPAQETRQRRLS